MEQGWIKFYREWLDDPVIMKDKDYFVVWCYLMLSATHKETKVQFGSEIITLKAGQLVTSYREIEKKFDIDKSKVIRIFSWLKNETLIDTVSNHLKTLVTIGIWDVSQNQNETVNDTAPRQYRDTEQETENEKEKRSKREKDKEKEINKNVRMEEVCVYGHTRENLILLGRYENVLVDREWYEKFKEKYWYYDKVIDKLSAYKKAKNIINSDDIPYLEQFAIEDKDKYIKREETCDVDEFFEAALKRSYADDDDE